MVHDKALREEVREKLHQAVKLILDSQNGEGGWRYTPGSRDADLSVTICQIMALRAARNAGIAVPQVDGRYAASNYVKALPGPPRRLVPLHEAGRRRRRPQGFARTAAGVVRPVQRRRLQGAARSRPACASCCD